MQKGYCRAMALSRRSVSSSGGFKDESKRIKGKSSSLSFFERGCLTILAVGKTVSGEVAEAEVTAMTLGFI
jgi:hypothetical protein